MTTRPSALHGSLPGGRTNWTGPDAYTAQMSDYERRANTLSASEALARLLRVKFVAAGDTILPGVNLLASTGDCVLPSSYEGTIYIKNISGSSINILPSAGQTIFANVSGLTTLAVAAGDSYTFAYRENVHYVI